MSNGITHYMMIMVLVIEKWKFPLSPILFLPKNPTFQQSPSHFHNIFKIKVIIGNKVVFEILLI